MFIVNWAYKAASYLGASILHPPVLTALLASGLWSKDAKILFLGLDNAGKTTMLHMLKEGKLSSHQPTFHPSNARNYPAAVSASVLMSRCAQTRVSCRSGRCESRLMIWAATKAVATAQLTTGIWAARTNGWRTARRLWNDYMTGVDAIIYMVDAFDRERFKEAKQELEVCAAYAK